MTGQKQNIQSKRIHGTEQDEQRFIIQLHDALNEVHPTDPTDNFHQLKGLKKCIST